MFLVSYVIIEKNTSLKCFFCSCLIHCFYFLITKIYVSHIILSHLIVSINFSLSLWYISFLTLGCSSFLFIFWFSITLMFFQLKGTTAVPCFPFFASFVIAKPTMKYIRTVFVVEWDMFRCDLWAREMFYFFLCCCLSTFPNHLYNKVYLYFY